MDLHHPTETLLRPTETKNTWPQFVGKKSSILGWRHTPIGGRQVLMFFLSFTPKWPLLELHDMLMQGSTYSANLAALMKCWGKILMNLVQWLASQVCEKSGHFQPFGPVKEGTALKGGVWALMYCVWGGCGNFRKKNSNFHLPPGMYVPLMFRLATPMIFDHICWAHLAAFCGTCFVCKVRCSVLTAWPNTSPPKSGANALNLICCWMGG